MKAFFQRFRAKKATGSSASLAKQRLSVLVHNEGDSEFSRELYNRIKECVYLFYAEKGLESSLAVDELSQELRDEGFLEVSIPLPD